MSNTILKQVNVIGEKLGYPFYVYADGSFGKDEVAKDGRTKAVIKVKSKFPVKSLNSDVVITVSTRKKELFACFSEIGRAIGYPFYVYSDGSCGTTFQSKIGHLPFFMMVYGGVAGGHSSPKVEKILAKFQVATVPNEETGIAKSLPTSYDLDCLQDVRRKLKLNEELTTPEMRVLVKFGTEKEVSDYVEHHFLYSTLLADYCSDDVVLKYARLRLISVTNLLKMLKTGRLTLIEKIQEVCSFNAINSQNSYFKNIEALIQNRKQKLLKTQIRKYDAWFENQEVLLVKSADEEMITYYLDYHPFKKPAQKALIELGYPNLIQLYQERYGFDAEYYQLAHLKRLLFI